MKSVWKSTTNQIQWIIQYNIFFLVLTWHTITRLPLLKRFTMVQQSELVYKRSPFSFFNNEGRSVKWPRTAPTHPPTPTRAVNPFSLAATYLCWLSLAKGYRAVIRSPVFCIKLAHDHVNDDMLWRKWNSDGKQHDIPSNAPGYRSVFFNRW